MSLPQPDPRSRCFDEKPNTAFIEFEVSPHLRVTLPVAQLARAVWRDRSAQNPPPQGGSERWQLCFATVDVVITGWRLDKLAALLREHKLALVRKLSLDPSGHQPFVADIAVFTRDEPDEPEAPVPTATDEEDMPPPPQPPDRRPDAGFPPRRRMPS